MSSFTVMITLTFLSCLCSAVSARSYAPEIGGGVGGLVGLVSTITSDELIEIYFLYRLY